MPSPTEIRRHIDSLAAPGGLGKLGELAARLCEIQNTLTPVASPRRVVLFADSGATTEMIRNVLSGGAASAVLAKGTNTDLVLIDIGSAVDALPDAPNYRSRKVRHGSRTTPLTADELRAAFIVGRAEAERAAAEGMKAVAVEELGGHSVDPDALQIFTTLGADFAELLAQRGVSLGIAAAAGFIARGTELGLTIVGCRNAASVRVAEAIASGTGTKILEVLEPSRNDLSALLAFSLLDAAVAILAHAVPLQESAPAEPKSRRVAVFTGSFDPPTTFHRKVARLVRGRGFDEVIVRPTGPRCDRPDGEHAAPIHRAVMADLAFRDLPGVSVDLGDLDDGTILDDYKFDEVYAERGEVWHVVAAEFLIRACECKSLIQTRWPNGEELWKNGRFVVLHPAAQPPNPADLPPVHKLIAIENHVPTADIRLRVFQGGESSPDVPEAVAAYIKRYRLFSDAPSPRETRVTPHDPRLMIVVDEHNARAIELAKRFHDLESSDPKAILVVGGDGTMLSAIRKHWRRRLPFIGVNAGTLGFLMNEELSADLAGLELVVYRMPMLRVDTTTHDGKTARGLAYSDAWVERDSGQAAWLRVDVDGRIQVPKVVGDGLLVATPSGSSAYARAMGATPVPLTAPVLTLAGSNVFKPRFWKPVTLPETAAVRVTNLDSNGKRPVRAFLDGHLVGRVSALEARVSSIAAVELAFTPQFDLSERLLRSMFPPSEEA
jgi:NAD kinase/nicotinic acid mononucleotide adenylyltransferase